MRCASSRAARRGGRRRSDRRRRRSAAAPPRATAARTRARAGSACGSGSRTAARAATGCRRRARRASASAARRDRGRPRPREAPACTGAAARRTARAVGAVSTICPRYITATRSQRNSTVARSCVMNRHEKPRSRCRSRSRLRIAACTETSSAETGSSAIEQRRRHRERAREADALPLPAGELVRVAVAQLRPQADRVEELATRRVDVAPRARCRWMPQRLADDLAARHARVQRRVRILEDDVQLAPQRPQLAARRGA